MICHDEKCEHDWHHCSACLKLSEVHNCRCRERTLTAENERLKTWGKWTGEAHGRLLMQYGDLRLEVERLKETERALTEKVMRYDHEVAVARATLARVREGLTMIRVFLLDAPTQAILQRGEGK